MVNYIRLEEPLQLRNLYNCIPESTEVRWTTARLWLRMQNRFGPGCGCNAQLVGGGTCGRGGKMVGTLCNAHNLQAQKPHFVAGAGFQPIKERKAATKRGQMRQALDASTTQRMAVRRALDNKGSRRLLGRKSELISGDALWRGGLSSPSPRRGGLPDC